METFDYAQAKKDFSAVGKAAEARSQNDRWMRLARAAWLVAALVALAILLVAIPGYLLAIREGLLIHSPGKSLTPYELAISVISGLMSLTAALISIGLAVVLYRRQAKEPMALFLSFYLLGYGTLLAGPSEVLEPLLPGIAALTTTVIAPLVLGPPSIALLVLFPDGRFVPRWTRWLVISSLVLVPLTVFPSWLSASSGVAQLVGQISTVLWLSIILAAFYAQIYRYRRVSGQTERLQTKWVVYGFSLWLLLILVSSLPYMYILNQPTDAPRPWWVVAGSVLWWTALTILPISLTVAISRRRLYDIDLIINRTLVYGALTASTMGIYVFIVGYLGSLFQARSIPVLAFAATGLVALLFQPLRERLQRGVNRLMYGERDDPVGVLSMLGERLEATALPEAVLPNLVETVAQALKLPYVAVELGEDEEREVAAAYGLPGDEAKRLPLVHQTETIGQLVVAPRAPGEPFNSADRMLLDNIARQAGAAVHAVQLTADLQRSRQRLVTAREEERRRLRRDLHDGLGPVLASQGLKLAAIQQLVGGDPAAAGQLMDEVMAQNEATVAEVRRLVYDLRPPALDELGLVGAIRDYVVEANGSSPLSTGMRVTIKEPPDGLPPLTAAVEVAAYRITLEALTNVARHARAQNCVISLTVDGTNRHSMLQIEIRDDGVGLPDGFKAGVGLNSMRERTAELGGTFVTQTALGHGTRVIARLPLTE